MASASEIFIYFFNERGGPWTWRGDADADWRRPLFGSTSLVPFLISGSFCFCDCSVIQANTRCIWFTVALHHGSELLITTLDGELDLDELINISAPVVVAKFQADA